jgi:hypothetical protein
MKKLYVAFVMAIVISLFLVPGCSTGDEAYDVRGDWNANVNCPTCYFTAFPGTFTFTGSLTSGTTLFQFFSSSYTGTYSVADNVVNFQFTVSSHIWSFTGNLTSSTSMNGTASLEGVSATWTASK